MKAKSIIVPVAFSLAAFILILLALLAGSAPGQLQDLDIITFNTSGLGKNLIGSQRNTEEPTPTTTDDGLCGTLGKTFGQTCASATAAVGDKTDEIVDKINDIGNDIADKLADRLGIDEFYSIYPKTICEGDFTPNATSPETKRYVKECKNVFPNGYNVSVLLDHGLQVGPFKATLADLGFSDELQDAIDTINSVIKAFVALLIIAVIFTGLCFLSSVVSYFISPRRDRLAIITNIILSTFASLFLLVTSILATVVAYMGVDEVNKRGDDIGLSASAGTGYTVITWVATGLVLIFVLGYWVWIFLRFKNGKMGSPSAGGSRKKVPRDSEETGHYSPDRRYGEKPSRSALSGWSAKRTRRI